jgi:hypothetical protein
MFMKKEGGMYRERTKIETGVAEVFRIFRPDFQTSDLLEVCIRVVRMSEFFVYSGSKFVENDIVEFAKYFCNYITDPQKNSTSKIQLIGGYDMGDDAWYNTFARNNSDDIFLFYGCYNYDNVESILELSNVMEEFFVAICFRYVSCLQAEDATFPVSVLLVFSRLVRKYLRLARMNQDVPDVVEAVVVALANLETVVVGSH